MSGGLAVPGPMNPAWINSSLTISPREQVDFIQKMVMDKLPISSNAIQMTKVILLKEESPEGWKLFGKTGWSGSDIGKDGKTLEHGWFVGWIEKDNNFFPFAYLIREQKINLDQRIPRVKQLLVESKIINDT
jgi:beta-lactamase class D